MPEDQDQLFTRLVDYYESQGRVDQLQPNPNDIRMARRVHIRYGNDAFGLLKIWSMAVSYGPGLIRQISWMRDVRLEADPEPPATYDPGAKLTLLYTWDEALAAIDGSSSM